MRFVFALWFCLATAASADPVEVDVELALMVDVSRSMQPWELEIQRRGYAEALASDEVIGVIENSFTGAIALTYVEWAGANAHRVVIPWTLIDGRAAAEDVAARLTTEFEPSLRRTSISGAIRFAKTEIETNDFIGLRQVIDVSGDGPNNDGRPVLHARQAAVDAGLIINGLPLMTVDDTFSRWSIPDLDVYYMNCVIGGPGAFAIPVLEWSDFPLAVRRKLVLELVGPADAFWPVQGLQPVDPDYDCMIGEKMRRERELIWGEP